MGCMLSAASCNQWWCEDILGTSDYASETASLRSVLGENSVYFLPYLMGERSPHNDPSVRGMFLGMSRDTTRADMTQAVLEGVAFGMRDMLEAARRLGASVNKATICGGGAKSELWRQICANVLDLPLQTVQTEEGPGYGAAILAAVGAGAFPDVQTAARALVAYGETITPDSEIAARYKLRYQQYCKLYPAIRDLF